MNLQYQWLPSNQVCHDLGDLGELHRYMCVTCNHGGRTL